MEEPKKKRQMPKGGKNPLAYSKEDIDAIIGKLLKEPTDIDKWHTPKGKELVWDSEIRIPMTREQWIVLDYLATRSEVTIPDLVKKVILRQWFKQNGYVRAIRGKISELTFSILFKFAAGKIETKEVPKVPNRTKKK